MGIAVRLEAAPFQNCGHLLLRNLRDAGGDGEILYHASHDEGADGGDEDAAAIGAGIVSGFAGRLPLVGVEVVGEADIGAFGGLAVVGCAFEVVGSGGASGEEDAMIAAGAAASDAETRGAGM